MKRYGKFMGRVQKFIAGVMIAEKEERERTARRSTKHCWAMTLTYG